MQADNRSMYYLFASVQINGTLATYPNTSVQGRSTSFCTVSYAFASPAPLLTRRAAYKDFDIILHLPVPFLVTMRVACDWCLRSDIMTNSRLQVIVTAVSSTPAGPYHWDRKTITIKARRPAGVWDQRAVTNPVVVRLRDGAGFVLFYVEQRSNTTDPYGTTGYSAIMAAFSPSLDGPWEVHAEPALKPSTSAGSWDNGVVCNPAAYVHPDNSVTLAYRWYNDFDIILDHLRGLFGLLTTPHTPWTVLYLVAMLIGCLLVLAIRCYNRFTSSGIGRTTGLDLLGRRLGEAPSSACTAGLASSRSAQPLRTPSSS